jgi:hypothetical protein
MLARRPLPSRKPRPLPRRQITADRPVQRRNRRRRLPLTLGRASDQLTMDRRDVALPQDQQAAHLRGDGEAVFTLGPRPGLRGRGLVTLGSGKPPPHRALGHFQRLSHQPYMSGRQFLVLPQSEQPTHGRAAQRRQGGRRQTSPRGRTVLVAVSLSRPGGAGHSGPMSRAQARSSNRRSTTARLLP